MKIGVVDYNAGNLTSVVSCLDFLNASYFVSSDPNSLIKADKLIFPGVGEASFAMSVLKKSGNDKMLVEFAKSGKQILGICLGAQILFSHSEENDTQLLSIIPGLVKRFPSNLALKVPHMGWNSVEEVEGGSCKTLFPKTSEKNFFYFVHSYYMFPDNKDVVKGICNYGIDFCAYAQKDNIFAAQFHPEKSSHAGLSFVSNFINLKE